MSLVSSLKSLKISLFSASASVQTPSLASLDAIDSLPRWDNVRSSPRAYFVSAIGFSVPSLSKKSLSSRRGVYNALYNFDRKLSATCLSSVVSLYCLLDTTIFKYVFVSWVR